MKKILLLLFVCITYISATAQLNTTEANYYTIKAKNTMYYLDMEGGNDHGENSITKMSARGTSFAQVWKIERTPDGTYKITNAVTGKSLDGNCSAENDDCQAVAKTVNNSVGQKWIITNIPTYGGYRIELSSSRKKLTSKYYQPTTLNSATVDNQIFEITPSNIIVKTNNFTDLRGNQTPYKNQAPPSGDRGGCTYFGSIAALEAAYKKVGAGDIDLSEEFMAITAKMFYLHPRWAEITKPNQRENQFAGTQGGGSIALLASGLKIPLESVVPYAQYTLSPNWASEDLKACNDFNYQVLNRFPGIKTATYYGVNGFRKIDVINAENLENVLRTGSEIKICIDNGQHCILLVGFDKTDPLNKKFIIKNSYNTQGLECYKKLEYFSYSEMGRLVSAEYITSVTPPSTWAEMKYIGRWNLNYGGWNGTLDIYHLPGVMQFLLSDPNNIRANGSAIKDYRIGVFYDHTGAAFRVNGYFLKQGNEYNLNFYIDNNKPNQRWDAMSGRSFNYKISSDGTTITGSHIDLDGRKYDGSGTRIL